MPESVSHKCSKISKSRWFGFFDTLNQFIAVWHIRLLIYVYLSMHLRYSKNLEDLNLMKAILPKVKPDEDVPKAPTKEEAPELMRLRRSCENTLHLATLVLGDPGVFTVCQFISAILQPMRDLHSWQSRTMKTCQQCGEVYHAASLDTFFQYLTQLVVVLKIGDAFAAGGCWGPWK